MKFSIAILTVTIILFLSGANVQAQNNIIVFHNRIHAANNQIAAAKLAQYQMKKREIENKNLRRLATRLRIDRLKVKKKRERTPNKEVLEIKYSPFNTDIRHLLKWSSKR
jgi:hypothetical protein